MMKSVVLLGSTGSIGVQTLDVAKNLNEPYKVTIKALSAHTDTALLEQQRSEFGVAPEYTCLSSQDPEKLCELASLDGGNCTVVNAIVGSAGLKPTLAALNAGNVVALANKETLVAGGELVMKASREATAKNNQTLFANQANPTMLVPVDSEHSAIMQCLQGNVGNKIHKIILTASGGAFYGYTKEKLKEVTREQALRHPNWSMGAKITVDSATLMNKGLELIEAIHLFDVDESQIEVVIHPQSIIHSAVEFEDGSVIAQLSVPDMRLPIQYALTYPARVLSPAKRLSLTELGALTFLKPDCDTFPLLNLAREAAKLGGDAPCILNAVNEKAVGLFLQNEIAFYEIPQFVTKMYNEFEKTSALSLDVIEKTESRIKKGNGT